MKGSELVKRAKTTTEGQGRCPREKRRRRQNERGPRRQPADRTVVPVLIVLKFCLRRGGRSRPGAGPGPGPHPRRRSQAEAAAKAGRPGGAAGCQANLCNRRGDEAAPPPRPRSLRPPPEPARLRSSFAANGTKRGGCMWWRGPSARAGRRGGGTGLRSPLAPGSRAPAPGALLLPAAASRTLPAPSCRAVPLPPPSRFPHRYLQHGLGLRGAQRRRAGLTRR